MPPKAPSSKRGKENAPVKVKAPKVAEEVDDFDAMMEDEPVKPVKKVGRPLKSAKKQVETEDMPMDEEEEVPSSKSAREALSKSSREAPASKPSHSSDELQRVKAECERLRRERDSFAKQFEELSSLRNSGPEALLVKFKQAAEAKAKAQAELIRNHEMLYEKQTTKVKALEETLAETREALARAEAAAGPPQFDAKLERMGARELRDEVFKLRGVVKAKDGEMAVLQREYQEEIAHSRKLQESQSQMRRSAEPPAKQPVNEVDSLAVRLYEEVTGLGILDASVRHDPKTGDERTYQCIQTTGGRNYTFRLRLRNDFDKTRKEWSKICELAPRDIEMETDRKLLKRLGPFCEPFELPREQLAEAWRQLNARMDPEGRFEEPE